MAPSPASQGFLYSANHISHLERALSTERFAGYLRRSGGDRELAVLYYEQNTALSEAMYGVIQGLEVVLRNTIHDTISAPGTTGWFSKLRLHNEQVEMVNSAESNSETR